jgi:hypothetical protein
LELLAVKSKYMNGINFSELLQKKFDEGRKLQQDQVYIQKREFLINNQVPLEETDVKNINKVWLDKKLVFVHLLTKDEDPSEKLIRTRGDDKEEWKEMELSFLISLYKSSIAGSSFDVLEWLRINKISFIEIAGENFVKCKPNHYTDLFVSKTTDHAGRIPVRYKLYDKEYQFSKERLLQILMGNVAPSNSYKFRNRSRYSHS